LKKEKQQGKFKMNSCNFLVLVAASVLAYIGMAAAGTIAPSASASRHTFARNLFAEIAPNHLDENVIYSPASIQSCLTLAFLGAEGQTEEEMRKGLVLGEGTKQSISENYAKFIESSFQTKKDEKKPVLQMANNIFLNDQIGVSSEFQKMANSNFDSPIEKLNMSDALNAVKKINSWVEMKTNNKIQNLLQADAVNSETNAILVNAIYFKGLWEKQFSDISTHKSQFHLNANQQTEVDMMYNDDLYNYVELKDLDATAIEMKYENSDLSMMIILPNQMNGLKSLESKLNNIDLNEISRQMQMLDVDVFLPKFKIEFDIDLKEPLKKLGMSSMFDNNANFKGIFETGAPQQRISEVRHKAYLSVNEAGSEAAAATYLKIVPMSLNLQQKRFVADHPFAFAIKDSKAVYFAGHVIKA